MTFASRIVVNIIGFGRRALPTPVAELGVRRLQVMRARYKGWRLVAGLVGVLAVVIFSIRSHPSVISSAIEMKFVGYTNLPGNDLRFALFSVSNQAAYAIRWRN